MPRRPNRPRRKNVVDTVRASRDGHQFHEAWVARSALSLLLSRNQLYAIAVEGLGEEDEAGSSAAAVEIADATFYYGDGASFKTCSRMEIAQFKYSIAAAETPLRVADVRKTLAKFAAAEADLTAKHDVAAVSSKLTYSLNSNRPVSTGFFEALRAASMGERAPSDDGQQQLDQLLATVSLTDDQLRSFISRVALVGRMEKLGDIEHANARTVVDWSASNDVLARARLGELRQLVRDKAGSKGQRNNLITQVDILAALNLANENELLPTPQAFPDVGAVVKRVQLSDFIRDIALASRWIVHAAGGLGKTVFVQSVAAELGLEHEVVLFDCFGGGAYRIYSDGRHKPERGLLHIVNELACRGLCDPILPGTNDGAEVVRRSIDRFRQAIQVVRRTKPNAGLFIIIDAADNAALEAERRSQPSFPRELLETLTAQPPIEGLCVIATARPERLGKAIGNADCKSFQVKPFIPPETEAFISTRRPDATTAQMQVVHRRAEGNPRVIANLIEPDRDLVGETQTETKVVLDSLIQERIDRAVKLADQKGAQPESISAFLCALSALPPPVPTDEIAIAFGISPAEVESFAADLSPLLDRTRHGIIFRDEPTETLVQQKYGSQSHLLNDVAARLTVAQASSVYAARSLPGLLFAMGRVDELRALAFDVRFPSTLVGDVAKRTIRLNRLRTAVGAAAQAGSFDAMVDLLVELSSVVAVDERGQDFLLAHPDLVVALGDPDALRRLFESKTEWPGSRHARLATAYATDGDAPEAFAHAKRAEEWTRWLWEQEERQRTAFRADIEDFVGIAVYLIASGRTTVAAQYLDQWHSDSYCYRVATRVFEICAVSQTLGKMASVPHILNKAVRCRKLAASTAVAILKAFPDLDRAAATKLLLRLAEALAKESTVGDDFPEYRESDSYSLALQRCSLRAGQLRLGPAAATLATLVAPKRFDLWSLRDPFSTQYVLPWVLSVAARASIEERDPTLFDCLPSELAGLVSAEPVPQSDDQQRAAVEEKLNTRSAATDGDKSKQLSESDRQRASDALKSRIPAILALARRIVAIVRATDAQGRAATLSAFFEGWKLAVADAQKDYSFRTESARFIDGLYSDAALHVFTALDAFTPQTAAAFVEWMGRAEFVPIQLSTELVKYFARNRETAAWAGAIAAKALHAIEGGDDVQQRSNLMARLARALLPANRVEATALFTRGLAELDAIGSGDQSFTNELLLFARSLNTDPLPSETAHRLAKICELNVYDSRKFPWPLTAAAFSRSWGAAYLAQIARWHDRGKVDWALTLPSALSFLVRDGLLRPDDALALLRLVKPEEGWDWDWDHLVESFIKVRPAGLATLLKELLLQFELAHPKRPHAATIDKMRTLIAACPAAASLAPQLERLSARAARPRRAETGENRRHNFVGIGQDDDATRRRAEDRERLIAAAIEHADPLSTPSIETLVAALDEIDGALDLKVRAFRTLRAMVGYADQVRHIDAIVSARNLQLFAKNKLLAEAKTDWLASSPSQLSVLKSMGSTLIREHASDLVAKDWGSLYEISELSQLTGQPREELAVALVDAAATGELDAAATVWLKLATILSEKANPSVPRMALERLLESGAARLADDVGDGVWTPAMEVDSNPDKVTAGLIWFGLGSPHTGDRWRAAHAVRTLATFGRWHVIDALVDLLDAPGAGPFQDQRLPFFVMHSRQWFLLAVARIALDHPAEIARHRRRLEGIAFNEKFPHVAMREASCRALLACIKRDTSASATRLKKRLRKIHVSQFPSTKARVNTFGTMSWNRPKNVKKPKPPFHFDYDFDKHNLSTVGNMFGLATWRIADRCVAWIRKWDPKIENMHDFGGRDRPSGHSNYSTGAEESFQSYGAYLARHAVALEAGRLLLTTPLNKDRYTYDKWEDWLSHCSPTRPDGLWVADGLGEVPDSALHELMADSPDGKPRPSDDQALLDTLAGVSNEGLVSAYLMIDGSWSSPDGVRVSVSSVLVPASQAEIAGRAIATASPMDMWLPSFDGDDEEHGVRFRRDMAPLEAWVTDVQVHLRIDDGDPSGDAEALQRPRPAKRVIKAFDLRPSKPWADSWSASAKRVAFRSLGWGRKVGEGEREQSDSGSALLCERAFLSELLAVMDRELLLLVKLEHYREKSRHDTTDEDPSGSFSHGYSILLVDRTLHVRRVVATTADLAAIAGLDEHSRYDFQKRLGAIERSDRASTS